MSDTRDLDRKIAEKVFGWEWCTESWFDEECLEVRVLIGPNEERYAPDWETHADDLPYYSTDPAASKLLREKLAEKYAIRVTTYRIAMREKGKGACAKLLTNGIIFASFEADTEELAVALCAIKVKGDRA